MAVDVHTLVQDAHDVNNAVLGDLVEQRVRTGGKFAVAGADLVAGSADSWVFRNAVNGML
ncbi:hypothetical protein MHEI_20520 [Mycobacterium heidelbergense]|nr:hypothetical protein MHEI_20520 [Mycobacterium heidelbergense]